MGIDRKAAARIERLVAQQPGVVRVDRSASGIEGEYALCIRAASGPASTRLAAALRQAMAVPVQAPMTLSTPGEAPLSAPLEQRR